MEILGYVGLAVFCVTGLYLIFAWLVWFILVPSIGERMMEDWKNRKKKG